MLTYGPVLASVPNTEFTGKMSSPPESKKTALKITVTYTLGQYHGLGLKDLLWKAQCYP